jgi:hypothetical protein
VVNAILYAAEHPVREIYVGGAGRAIELLHSLSPNLTDWLLSRFSYPLQMTNEPKTDQDPNNLYHHIEGYDQIQGSFSKGARSISLYTGLGMHPAFRWGLLGVLTGLGFVLMNRHKS